MADLFWGIDGAFGPKIEDHLANMKANGLRYAFIRMGEGMYSVDPVASVVNALKVNQIPVGLYWAIHPWYGAIDQVEKFLSLARPFGPTCLALDFELLWNEMTPEQLSDHYQEAFNHLQARWEHQCVNYSGEWFLDCVPKMRTWITQGVYWAAEYVPFNPTNWSQFQTQIQAIGSNWPNYDVVGEPKIWQFHGTELLPWVPHDLDYNLIKDVAVLNAVFPGSLPPVTPPPTTPPLNEIWQVAPGISFLTVRSGPGVQYAPVSWWKWLKGVIIPSHPVADRVTIIEKSTNNWGRFSDGWVNLNPPYMVRIS